jgi:hypothetical protein
VTFYRLSVSHSIPTSTAEPPVLLAVAQQLAKARVLGFPSRADRIGALQVKRHRDGSASVLFLDEFTEFRRGAAMDRGSGESPGLPRPSHQGNSESGSSSWLS